MTTNRDFELRRVVAVIGERNAPAAFQAEGVLVIREGDEELVRRPETRAATPEEVAAIFGDGHTQQLDNIAMLTQRMAEQQAAAAAVLADARADADARLKAAGERAVALQGEIEAQSNRALAAERKLAAIADADAAYDAHVKPLLAPT